MIIKEYRIPMPMTVEEYQRGQLWTTAEVSRRETGGGEGVEVVENKPFHNYPISPDGRYKDGQYTHKIYHLKSKIPELVRELLPNGLADLHEYSWNAFPYTKTIIKFAEQDKKKNKFKIECLSMHLNDHGNTFNALQLSPELLEERDVGILDIRESCGLHTSDLLTHGDPAKIAWRGRGPLSENWQQKTKPIMCAYKVVKIEFKYFGLQTIVESHLSSRHYYPRLFKKFHREIYCWMDQWGDLKMKDIRRMEDQMAKELDEARKKQPLRGMMPDDEGGSK